MRSSGSGARRGHRLERTDYVNADVNAGAAGWPLGRRGKASAMEGGTGMASPGAEKSRSFDILAQEVEELIERQPQFGFLKPCRQLEMTYAKRSGMALDSSSFRHSHVASDALASKDERGIEMQSGSSSRRVEDAPQKPGSSTVRELLLSCEGIELNGFVETKSGAQSVSSTARVVTKEYHDAGQARRHGRGHFHRNSGERIWRISSTRCSIHEKEAHIDLVNPAAAKFLMEMSPGNHASPPTVAVPFKWEDAPGRAKAHAEAATNPTLQLPPRLAAPRSEASDTALSRQLRVSVVSHPLTGLFPCMGASSPSPSRPLQLRQQQHQQHQDHITWMQYRASKSYGGVYQNARKQSKSFSQPLASTDQSMGLKPRRLFSSELGSSGGGSSTDPSSTSTSSSSILHGSRQSSSSRTYLSCELDASTPRTAGSKSSSSASYESIGEDFDHDDSSASPHSARPPPAMQSRRDRRSESKGLLKLCKSHGNCLRKSKSHRRIRSPEVWAPTLATYFQRLDVNDEPLLEKQGAAPTSSGYLNSKGEPLPLPSAQGATPTSSGHRNSKGESARLHCAVGAKPTSSANLSFKGESVPLNSAHGAAPTSSGYLNCRGEPVPLQSAQGTAPTSSGYLNCKGEPVPLQGAGGGDDCSSSPEISPKRPTRLPYKMPSVAEQERERCRSRHRSALSIDLKCPSPAYAAALEMLSPAAVTLMASRRHHRGGGGSRTVASPKPHRRVQFILSMCKTLKRVLFRQQPRRSVIGTRLMYHDERAPTSFQFSKPN